MKNKTTAETWNAFLQAKEGTDAILIQDLRNQIVTENRGLVFHYMFEFRLKEVEDSDYEQELMIALINAVEHYDPRFSQAFSSYAFKYYFRPTLWKTLGHYQTFPEGRQTRFTRHQIIRAKLDLSIDGQDPTPEAIAEVTGINTSKVKTVLETPFTVSESEIIDNLKKNSNDFDDSISFGELFVSPYMVEDLVPELQETKDFTDLHNALRLLRETYKLSPLDTAIIENIWFADTPMQHSVLAKTYGCTRQAVGARNTVLLKRMAGFMEGQMILLKPLKKSR